MKQILKEAGAAWVLGFLVPAVVLFGMISISERYVPEEQIPSTATSPEEKRTVKVLDKNGALRHWELEEYLVGVVLAEMPASFEPEALKAQAVVARTYTIRAEKYGDKHGEAAVCTDSACCQAYRNPEAYLQAGGTQEGLDKVRSSVEVTEGLVLTYGGELIEATYFSCSGGSTEDAVAVWGTDVPYLKAVSSPGEEDSSWYATTRTFTAAEFSEKLGLKVPESLKDWFGEAIYTAGGGVGQMIIGGTSFTGTQLRSLLELPSTAISVSVEDDLIAITCRGYGHRVGMSQYGADAMAGAGSKYPEILEHYYQGTALVHWTD